MLVVCQIRQKKTAGPEAGGRVIPYPTVFKR
jgi:hypothetical protein